VQGARREPAQHPQPAPGVICEVGAQPLRDGQHHLPVRHRREQVLGKPQAPLRQTARVAGGAELPPLAAERHQELGPARAAAHTREPVLQPPAVEEPPRRTPCRRTQRAMRGLEARIVHPLQCGEVVGQHPVVAVFDVSGKKVRTLSRVRAPGDDRVYWDGSADDGRRLGPGVYFARIRVGGRVESVRMVLLK